MERMLKTLCLAMITLFLAAGVALAVPPDVPTNPNPDGTSLVTDMTPTLGWDGGPAGATRKVQIVILDPNNDTPYLLGRYLWVLPTTTNSVTVPNDQALPPNTTFHWRVKACTGAGCVWGPPELWEELTVPGSNPPVTYYDWVPQYWEFTTDDYGPVVTGVVPATDIRPSYPIQIKGKGFGIVKGKVKLVKKGTGEVRWINGLDFGRITSWSDESIGVQLPPYERWSGLLPGTFKVWVFVPNGTTPETYTKSLNIFTMNINYGGGGTTWAK